MIVTIYEAFDPDSPMTQRPSPPAVGSEEQIGSFKVEVVTLGEEQRFRKEYRALRPQSETVLATSLIWDALCEAMGWFPWNTEGGRSSKRAAHAGRWNTRLRYLGDPIEGVCVTTNWHVVLTLPDRFVELDPDDRVVAERTRAVAAKTPEVVAVPAEQPDEEPDAALPTDDDKPAQQELF